MAIEVVDQAQPGVQVDRRATSAGPSRTPKAIPERAANIVPTVGECDVLVESTLVAPIGLNTQPFAAEWRLVKGKRVREIERELRASGWHLFYVIPDANGTGIARRPEDAVRKAFAKVFRKAFEQGLNTLEIASLRVSALFGFYRAQVTVKLRHIQKSPYLFTTNEEMRERMLRVRTRSGLLHIRPWHMGRSYREYKAF
jgi:hypothetical protein